jgi:hypothetical protein
MINTSVTDIVDVINFSFTGSTEVTLKDTRWPVLNVNMIFLLGKNIILRSGLLILSEQCDIDVIF